MANTREVERGFQWRPIETARIETPRVLLYGPDGVDIGSPVIWSEGLVWERICTAEYDNEGARITSPTHWMPLPPPPTDTPPPESER